jgi:CheY-like chemotaxis protein
MSAGAPEAGKRTQAHSMNFSPSSERTILIVDDNVVAAESLGEVLRACGHTSYIAYDGPSAIIEAARSACTSCQAIRQDLSLKQP